MINATVYNMLPPSFSDRLRDETLMLHHRTLTDLCSWADGVRGQHHHTTEQPADLSLGCGEEPANERKKPAAAEEAARDDNNTYVLPTVRNLLPPVGIKWDPRQPGHCARIDCGDTICSPALAAAFERKNVGIEPEPRTTDNDDDDFAERLKKLVANRIASEAYIL
jgi:hypothetical protein